jgi:hypothetical protein
MEESMRGGGPALGGYVLLATLVAGCGPSSGVIAGQWVPPGRPAEPVSLAWQARATGGEGTLAVTLPDGEAFTGNYLQVVSGHAAAVIDPFMGGYPPYWNDWGPFGDPWTYGNDARTFARNYSGRVIATLLGDRGSAMRCRFQLLDPTGGMKGGGRGECEVSRGGHVAGAIDARF